MFKSTDHALLRTRRNGSFHRTAHLLFDGASPSSSQVKSVDVPTSVLISSSCNLEDIGLEACPHRNRVSLMIFKEGRLGNASPRVRSQFRSCIRLIGQANSERLWSSANGPGAGDIVLHAINDRFLEKKREVLVLVFSRCAG